MPYYRQFLRLFLFSLMTITLFGKSSQQDCSASNARKIDGIMAKLMTIGNSGRKFPESKGEDLKKFCDDSKTYILQIEEYKNKCLKGRPKQITAIVAYSIKNAINNLCKRDSKRLNELLDAAVCMNKGSNELNKCYTGFIDTLLGAKNAIDDKKIPYYCCGYFKLFPCIESRLEKVSGCSNNRIELTNSFINSLFGDSIKLSCGEFNESSDRCQKLEPVPKKKKNQRRTKSFMLPLVDLLSSFDEV